MTLLFFALILILASTESFAEVFPAQRSPSGFSGSLPITRRERSGLRKRRGSQSGAIGLGDKQDRDYSVQIFINDTAFTVILDTGSSDLWAITDICTARTCGNTSTSAPQLSHSHFKFPRLYIEFHYGDSTHRTFALGGITSGNVSLAGLQLNDQSLCGVDFTNATSDDGSSGIFGLGFPNPISGVLDLTNSFSTAGSLIFQNLLFDSFDLTSVPNNFADVFISKLPSQGPFLSRLVANRQLQLPMFTVTLEREDIEVGGNVGQLTIGQLPDGVSYESLTWVPVRLYTPDQGGMSGPTTNPNELYPVWWEIPIDDVVLNGQTLPKPALKGIGYTALIDSRASFLAGPKAVVSSIYNATAISGSSGSSNPPLIDCTRPVNLTFVIGGKNFPVDPRDFLSQQTDGTNNCNAGSVLPKDPPSKEIGLMSWILGDPFMKSNLVAFYYGNLTHPSVDPPRIGFLSTVPSNAADLMAADVKSAGTGGFVVSSVSAPTTTFAATSTNSLGVGQAPTGTETSAAGASSSRQENGASQMHVPLAVIAVVTSLWRFLT